MKMEHRSFGNTEQGAALIVVLMLLLVVTLLGLASMRGAILQERMAGATLQRSEAFQAAESALREGEAAVQNAKPGPFPATGCANGLCATTPVTSPPTPPAWQGANFWTSGKATTATTTNTGMTSYYVIEDYGLSVNQTGSLDPAQTSIGSAANVYRIVSHAEATSGSGSEVTLQSIYRVNR